MDLSKKLQCLVALSLCGSFSQAQDPELANYNSGIDVVWGVGDGSDKGTAYAEEYLFSNKLISDQKIVYIKSDTPIRMLHNERNVANYSRDRGGLTFTIGTLGRDGVADSGDEGTIRFKIDRDRQVYYKWAQNYAKSDTARRLPAYAGAFKLQDLSFEPGVPVVGTVGDNGKSLASKADCYFRGVRDSFGDEWHTLAYADDDESFLRKETDLGFPFVDQAFYASDGKTVLLVVNPKTPCFTARGVGTGQFYTTPPKPYWTPKVLPQTTYISGTVSIELRDINGKNVFYRIGGSGAFTDAGRNFVSLSQDLFNVGSNVLEYYYAGNESFTKTRTIVKEPSHPSLAERHGNYLWGNASGFTQAVSRLSRAPYANTYNGYKTRSDFSGQATWDANAGRGKRLKSGEPLKNAFVALVEGWDFKRSGAAKSHGRYAKEMLLENTRTLDPMGCELGHSAEALPNRELHYRGYYDSVPVLQAIFAYDLIAAHFRSDQVSGGLTPIEDLFVRDTMAGFAYEQMQHTAGMSGLDDSPGMWAAARLMCATSIAIIMPEYSTPYFGTSGFGSVQATFPLCPYQDDRYTWKAAMFDANCPKKGYPNMKWYTGLSDNGAESLFMDEGQKMGDRAYPLGTWIDKAAYFQPGLMGIHLMIWSNMAKRWCNGKTDARLEIAINNATSGQFIGAKDPYPQTPAKITTILWINKLWPIPANNIANFVKSLPPSDSSSADKAMQDAGVFGFAWYDDKSLPSAPKNLRLGQ